MSVLKGNDCSRPAGTVVLSILHAHLICFGTAPQEYRQTRYRVPIMAATMTTSGGAFKEGNEKFSGSYGDESALEKSTSPSSEEYSPREEKKIIHRVDRRLVVTCGVMYCVSLMDRTNLGLAAVAGMLEELELAVGYRYVSCNLDSTALGTPSC